MLPRDEFYHTKFYIRRPSVAEQVREVCGMSCSLKEAETALRNALLETKPYFGQRNPNFAFFRLRINGVDCVALGGIPEEESDIDFRITKLVPDQQFPTREQQHPTETEPPIERKTERRRSRVRVQPLKPFIIVHPDAEVVNTVDKDEARETILELLKGGLDLDTIKAYRLEPFDCGAFLLEPKNTKIVQEIPEPTTRAEQVQAVRAKRNRLGRQSVPFALGLFRRQPR